MFPVCHSNCKIQVLFGFVRKVEIRLKERKDHGCAGYGRLLGTVCPAPPQILQPASATYILR